MQKDKPTTDRKEVLKDLMDQQDAEEERWRQKEQEMINERKESLMASASERHKAVNSLKKEADDKKAEIKKWFDASRAEARHTYEVDVKRAAEVRDFAIEEANEEREKEYNTINHDLAKAKKPIVDKHMAEEKEIEESFNLEMEKIHKKRMKGLKRIGDAIEAVAAEITGSDGKEDGAAA